MEHVYIHIPFCKSICSYCDFCKTIYREENVGIYLDALENEIKEFYMNEEIKTIYIGGGTPSSLSIKELIRLFDIIKIFNKSSDLEFTFECNINDINEDLVDILVINGVNRVSIGVESFDCNKLKFMERNTNNDDLKSIMCLLRYKGINNINLDLMYGIPGETFDVLKKDVKTLLKYNPTHISTYSLIVEDNTKVKINGYSNISEDIEYKMYEYIVKKLKRKGYIHYETSNFALKGYESKHNLCYWDNLEYYGFGLGASGYMNGFRYDNTKSLSEYVKNNYRLNESLLSKQEIMEYELMLGFRKCEGINIMKFYQKYGVNIQDVFPIKPLIRSKDLIYKNGYIFINPEKIYVMNEILLKLI